jgi:hypothetical protein
MDGAKRQIGFIRANPRKSVAEFEFEFLAPQEFVDKIVFPAY